MQWQDDYDTKTIKRNWQDAENYCNNLILDGKNDWRLPNVEEFKYAYKIENNFKNIFYSYPYWSSSSNVSYDSNAWVVYFDDGNNDDNHYKSGKCSVRCVRGSNFDTLTLLEKTVKKTKKLYLFTKR